MAIFTEEVAREFASRIGSGRRDLEYFKATMRITWRSRSGRVHVRHVDLGHVPHNADFDGLAVLNVGARGRVVSHTVERAA